MVMGDVESPQGREVVMLRTGGCNGDNDVAINKSV